MAQNRMTHSALLDQLQGADTDVLRRVLEHAMQRLIEAEAETQIGAGPHERSASRTTYRNGYRERILDTGSGRLELQIPKLRSGSFFPTLLEPRRRIDRALLAVVQEAYVLGISTRKADDLMAALGGCSISRSEVSRICALLDEELAEFRERPLDEPYPYVWFDATYEKVRQGARIVSQAAVVAVGVRDTGEKSVLGLAVGASETEAFWLVLPQLVAPRAERRAAGYLRCARGAAQCVVAGVRRRDLATLQGAFPAQRGERRPQAARAGRAHGGEVDLLADDP
jgi:putative transposase